MLPSPPRILIHSHDSFGLGHLRRCLLIAERLSSRPSRPQVLITTGSPAAGEFDLPRGVDLVRLPAAVKSGGRYVARSLDLDLDELVALRSGIVVAAARAFRPDVVLIDHTPAGLAGELRSLLTEIDRWPHRPVVALGLRDIIDSPARAAAEWERDGLYELVDDHIDRILVYGDRSIGTTATELGFAQRFPGRVRHVGYVARRCPHRDRARRQRTVVVTAGGGGDGGLLVEGWARLLETDRDLPVHSIVVLGPLMDAADRRTISSRLLATGSSVEIATVHPHADELVASADAAITMAGYNTAAEVMSSGTPTLFVPRSGPRMEQRIRAERLAATNGAMSWCPPEALDPEVLRTWLGAASSSERSSPAGVDLAGADRVADLLLAADLAADPAADPPTDPPAGPPAADPTHEELHDVAVPA